jgi:transcriptional regulator with XRE-family HTH domain
MNPQVTFVTRLRRERLRLGIALDDIARQSRIKPELLEAFENNDLTDWPKGLYARAWVRAYAIAVGLDPADTVDEFCRLYLHGDRRARSTIREIAEITATDSEYRDDIGHEDRRRGGRAAAPQPPASWYAPFVQFWRMLRARVVSLFAFAEKPREARRAPRTS